ncbi:unnamed protein product [Pedinophyceae sp. YPF-701]|nr:unnamed protein product [Pedinophyceae sp. YPF-701]
MIKAPTSPLSVSARPCWTSRGARKTVSVARRGCTARSSLVNTARDVRRARGGGRLIAAVSPPGTEMQTEMRTVTVDLKDRSYPIYIGTDLIDQPELLARHIRGKSCLVITNTTLAPMYLNRVVEGLRGIEGMRVEEVVLPDGEEFKSVEVLGKIWDKAIETRLDRKTTFIALGGGVIGDMTGFAAAAYLRGVDFIQIPTTVMAMVDSSVGGKTGVNHPLGKNMIGAFHQPQCVLADMTTLQTLPDRELASGIAEVVKYGLIRDAEFFEWLESNMERLLARDADAFAHTIERSCVNKAEVVAADEREGGVRATLNLGHTFGHAIENHQGYGAWLHGEAVSAGMVMASWMSWNLGWIEEDLYQRTLALLKRAKTPTESPSDMKPEDFMRIMAVDKKVVDGNLRLILLKGPLGNCVVTGDFDPAVLQKTLEHFCK